MSRTSKKSVRKSTRGKKTGKKKKSASKPTTKITKKSSTLPMDTDRVLQGWIKSAELNKPSKATGATSLRVFLSEKGDRKALMGELKNQVEKWQVEAIEKSQSPILQITTKSGPSVALFPTPGAIDYQQKTHSGLLDSSSYGTARDMIGELARSFVDGQYENIDLVFLDGSKEFIVGALVGLEIAHYRYTKIRSEKTRNLPQLFFRRRKGSISKDWYQLAVTLGQSVNLSRHMVNLPSNELNPESYAGLIEKTFKNMPGTSIKVLSGAQIEKEKMGLLKAVGQAAEHGPRLVHVKYRPSGTKNKKPVAFVGKGITFDSGGLDLKPARAMRLMKKDMGGSASVLGIAYWAIQSRLKTPLDFYFCLAENAVAGNSFRPGDVITARNGMNVEIHNTDAEGRLVLADGLCMASEKTGNDKPRMIVNLATLTGACKVGIGSELAGLFSTEDKLIERVQKSAHEMGDLVWPLPMFQKLRKKMSSPVAHMTNAVDGFGGAITAALFLESFTRNIPFIHFDFYAWVDAPEGAFGEPGGSGQLVQLMSHFLRNLK